MNATLREQVRNEIRAELARHNPLETARVPLELIAETSIRLVEGGGPARYQVIDQDGQPRTKTENGQPIDLTIRDLVAELRNHHPTLFQPANDPVPEPVSPPAEPGETATAAVSPAAQEAVNVREAPRDWLRLDQADPAADKPEGGLPPDHRPATTDAVPADWTARLRAAPAALAARLREARRPPAATPAAVGLERSPPAVPPAPATTPNRSRRPLYGALAGAAVLLLAGVWAFGSGPAATDRAAPSRPDRTARAPAEPVTTGTLKFDNGAPGAATGSGPVNGVPEVVDTGTLRIDGKVVRLFGVDWARGGQSEDLTRYLRGREIACQPVPGADTYRCRVEGRDLSEVVLYNGGGRVTANATPDLVAAENHARTERLGIWRK